METPHYGSIELEVDKLPFFSQGDETAFFGWLNNLSIVEKIEGSGTTLLIKVHYSTVDEEGLRELLAIFHRYCIDMRQLIVFDIDEFGDWFRSSDSYWYKSIFGPPDEKGA